jgi:hypothetical protein
MTSGTGTCTSTVTWAADGNYNGATKSQSTAATKITPTTTFTGAPASAAFGSSFTVASTTNSSATPAYTSSGGCSNVGTSYTMTSGTTACTSTVTWAADSNYYGATKSQTTTASKINPTVSLSAPASAAFGSSFTAVATTNASTLAAITVDAGSVGVCSISGTTVTMLSGSGTCALTSNWAADSNYNSATAHSSTTALKASTVGTLSVTPTTAQYSDLVSFTATLSPASLGGQAPATSVTFYVGTQTMGTATLVASGGTLTGTLPNLALLEPTPFGTAPTGQMAPGSHSVTAVFGGVNSNFNVGSPSPATLAITQEDARVTYAGNLFVGIPLSSTSGSITLNATISDITAVTGDPAYDTYAGDIRNATLTFVDAGNGNATLCTGPILLVNASDTKTGSVTCTFTGTVDSTGSRQYTVGMVVGGYYVRNASTDDTVVTISQVGAGMITGGGYAVMTNSGGTIAGDPGTKNNFGFNVKYNKSGTNLQGNLNTIVRRKESDGIYHVYQIKGNSMTALAVYQKVGTAWVSGCASDPSTTSPCKAQFNGKANIQDITNPASPVSVPGSGNSALQFNMTDYGSPGSSDTIGITVWNTSGGIWFSTNWVGTPPATVEQLTGGGNLVVH